MQINENTNYKNIEIFENEISNSNSINILNTSISIDNKTFNRSDVKSEDALKYVIYTDNSDKFSWFEVYFTTNPFKFKKLEDYTI